MKVDEDYSKEEAIDKAREKLRFSANGTPIHRTMVNTLPIHKHFIRKWFKDNTNIFSKLPPRDAPFIDPIRMYNRLLVEKEAGLLTPTHLPGMGEILRKEVPPEACTGFRFTSSGARYLDMFHWKPLYTLQAKLGDSFTIKLQELTESVGIKGEGAKHITKVLNKMRSLHPKGKFYEYTK